MIQHQRGFTFIELIVTLLVVSLLLAWGMPAYREFKLRQDMISNANEMVYSFNLARAEAIKRGNNVSIVKTGTDWHDGWRVVNVPDDEEIAVQDRFNGEFKMSLVNGAETDVQFDNLGGLVNNPISFTLSHADLPDKRHLEVNLAGSIRTVSEGM